MFVFLLNLLPEISIFCWNYSWRRPAALLKLDIRYKTLITYQTFDCIVKVKAEFMNKSKEYYNDNEDIAVMMFDINYGYRRCCWKWRSIVNVENDDNEEREQKKGEMLSPCLCFLRPNKGQRGGGLAPPGWKPLTNVSTSFKIIFSINKIRCTARPEIVVAKSKDASSFFWIWRNYS